MLDLRDRPPKTLARWELGLRMATQDMKSAEKTYGSFINWLKWAVPIIAIITLIIVMLIA